MFFTFWFDDVQNDAYSIFVVISDDALIGICRVGVYNSISFQAVFGRFFIR